MKLLLSAITIVATATVAQADTVLVIRENGNPYVWDTEAGEIVQTIQADHVYIPKSYSPQPPKPDPPAPEPPTGADYTKGAIEATKQLSQSINKVKAQALIAVLEQIEKSGIDPEKVLDFTIPKIDSEMEADGSLKRWYAAVKRLGPINVPKLMAAVSSVYGVDENRLIETVSDGIDCLKSGLTQRQAAEAIAGETEEIFDIAEILRYVQLVRDIIELIRNLREIDFSKLHPILQRALVKQ